MAYVSSDLPLAGPAAPFRLADRLAALFERATGPIRRRLVYHQTLFALQGCSERMLRDIGVDGDVEAFARRAAGLSSDYATDALNQIGRAR